MADGRNGGRGQIAEVQKLQVDLGLRREPPLAEHLGWGWGYGGHNEVGNNIGL